MLKREFIDESKQAQRSAPYEPPVDRRRAALEQDAAKAGHVKADESVVTAPPPLPSMLFHVWPR